MKRTENDFWKNAEAKEMAVKYFPCFFGNDLNVTTKYDINELEKQYLRYCKKYSTIYSTNSADERFYIQMAYEYMKNILKEQTKFEVNSHITKSILQSYKSLISTMSTYSFNPHWANSYGALQNETNKKILLEISLFHPFFTGVLKNIDNYLEKVSEPGKIDVFYCELIKNLENLNDRLDNKNSELLNAQYEYHNTWNEAKRGYRGGSTDSDLGFTKKNWRLARNNACHCILNFFKELEGINKALYCEAFKRNEENYAIPDDTTAISETYNNGIANIVKSPNYFCYLNEKEKEELTQQKILKKNQSK